MPFRSNTLVHIQQSSLPYSSSSLVLMALSLGHVTKGCVLPWYILGILRGLDSSLCSDSTRPAIVAFHPSELADYPSLLAVKPPTLPIGGMFGKTRTRHVETIFPSLASCYARVGSGRISASVAFSQLPLPYLPVPVRQDVGFLQIGAIATATPLRRLRGHHTPAAVAVTQGTRSQLPSPAASASWGNTFCLKNGTDTDTTGQRVQARARACTCTMGQDQLGYT